ncbi:type II toxin-antitoxin system RelB/DinJ family antitoxin [Eubacterium xylanophilum]|uniref:type II toxin-antitoxin system RelB/DinJ family antitoxin n=1 Tax=Eubacterium xylanophilum TaxID=39497 RepID=UPI00047D46BA|nr:type II toxin-antitoxin system RelB/DinJ family antitoxin [Eubacterium xylanophilum]
MSAATKESTTTTFSVRMDKDIKSQCETMYGELGINLTTAINVFLRQSLRAGGFPFDVRLDKPNQETIAAMMEANSLAHNPNIKKYSDVEEALAELKR